MNWTYSFDARALRELKKLDIPVQREILSYLEERIVGPFNPRRFGKPLHGEFSGLWRYRIGSYRLICQIKEDVLLVLVVAVGHRKEVYRRK